MNKLKFCKNNRLFYDDQEIKRDSVNFTEFFIANLDTEVEYENGLTIEELVHFFYDCKDFIYSYFSEHYEVLRAYLTVKNLQQNYFGIKICKKIHIDEGYISIVPCVDFVLPEKDQPGTNVLAKIKIIKDDELNLMEDDLFAIEFEENRNLKEKLRSKITLQDTMRSLFEDLTGVLEENIVNL